MEAHRFNPNDIGKQDKFKIYKNMTGQQVAETLLQSREFLKYMQRHYQIVPQLITKKRIREVRSTNTHIIHLVHK
jgi:hypothetical protein